MTKNQIDRMLALLQELRQIIEELDCGPVERHACVDTDDMAYIELPVDGDGTARSMGGWTLALEALVALAHAEWSQREIYAAFRAVMNNTNPFETPLPDWEEVEQLMEEHARVRRNYPHLLAFLERPEAYANSLDRQAETLARESGLTFGEAKTAIAAVTLSKFQQELEFAQGEKATPAFAQMYDAHAATGGDNIAAWLAKWLES